MITTDNKLDSPARGNLLQDYFSELVFNELNHTYRVASDLDRPLTSVTQYIKKFVEQFKTHQVASFVAKANGKKGLPSNPDYYKRYWNQKGLVSRESGTLMHLYAQAMPTLAVPQTKLEEAIKDYYETQILPSTERILATELITYFGSLAGTIDLVTEKEDGTLRLTDWKSGESDFDKSYSKMLPPFQDFKDSKRNQYTIQLALYAYLIESATHFKVSELTVVGITDAGWRIEPINDELVKHLKSLFKSKQTNDGTTTQ